MDCIACHTPNIDGARFCAKCGAPIPVARTPDADPLIGVTIGGRYSITGILGEGGMGRVYTGEQQMGTSVRKVAVKTLLSQFAKDENTVARFMREVGTVSELEHPNTIKVYDFGKIEGSGDLYIAMELLQGKTLDDLLTAGEVLSAERVDKIVGQICGSLQEAHDKGIVHRDLKPANIFLTTRAGEEDYVKVLDFGIAKKSDSKDSKQEQKLTQQGTILGTPPYMSPEQFSGKELDARSDIYSLGVVTYEMLTGRLPYEADTPWQWMTAHMSASAFPFETTPLGANVPHKMRAAVMRALSKSVADRPQTSREFYEDLTLGGARMSVIGLGTAGVGGMNQGASTAVLNMAGAPAGTSRPGGTQMGTPIFADQAGAAPGKTIMGTESAGMPAYAAAPVPTAGGQVMAAPRPAPRSGVSLGLIGALAFLVIGGGVGAFFYMKNRGGDDGSVATVPIPKSSETKSDDDGDEDDTSAASTSDASSSSGLAATDSTSSGSGDDDDGGGDTSSSSSGATETPTATTTATTRPTTTATATNRPQPGVDHCCNAISAMDSSKRKLCGSINAGIKAGTRDRAASMATLRSQGIPCN